VEVSARQHTRRRLRTFGLRCVSIEEVTTQENKTMDMRKYTSGLIMPEDLRNGPRQERIIAVTINEKHDVPVLEFESGDQLFVWASIGRVLGRAFGTESDAWIGHVVKLSLGHYGEEKKETIILEAISSRDGAATDGNSQRVDPAKLPAPVKRGLVDDMDDEIPY
jgi:co-chaperonin GroES (HSP10)